MVKVKICGITSVTDAINAVEAGTDALGFIFFEKSPRFLTTTAAAEIIRELPPFVAKVGVFVNPAEDFVREALLETGIDTVQFHGDEPPGFCRSLPCKRIKAFRVAGIEAFEHARHYAEETWLLDAFAPGVLGGSGATFNWQLALEAQKLRPTLLLAGGLTPDNVAEAVSLVRPYAVDVSSGVESAPGKKDSEKVRRFIQNAKEA